MSREVDLVLAGLRVSLAAVPERVVYLSGAITGGRRSMEAELVDPRYRVLDMGLHDRIVAENVAEMESAAAELRRRYPGSLVVCPSDLRIPGWSQRSYNKLWTTVVSELATSVVLMPGFEFSTGARMEVNAALAAQVALTHFARGAKPSVLDRDAISAIYEAVPANDFTRRLPKLK